MAWEIDAKTKIIALVGDPIEHSLTPIIQNAALKRLGANVRNIAFKVPKGFLCDVVKGFKVAGVLGLMVTIPHKEEAFKLADERDSFAELMGSANLLVFKDGKVIAYSTDGYAASRSLKEAGVDIRNKKVAIIGTGGAGRALAFQFALDGAQELLLFNRTVERAKKLRNELKRNLGFSAVQVFTNDLNLMRSQLINCDLLVNATSVGMHPNENETPVPAEALHRNLVVFDIVYNPVQTRLLREAKHKGCKTVDGVPMLVYTNEKAIELCLEVKVSNELVSLMLRTCYKELKRRL
ncbi:MAG: shikimate dehydrogenase [Armatimonadetes bacterium]|nr:shikimate dehydrogenase [Armatimonadota bacterium]